MRIICLYHINAALIGLQSNKPSVFLQTIYFDMVIVNILIFSFGRACLSLSKLPSIFNLHKPICFK